MTTKESGMTLKVGSTVVSVAGFPEASRHYGAMRDESGEGASAFPVGKVMSAGKCVAWVSYNGNVWPPKKWHSGMEPLLKVAGVFS